MRAFPPVRSLEPAWQPVIDATLSAVARREGRAPLSTRDVARLSPKLVELSRAYNEGEAEGAKTKLPLDARVAFSFVRDVPKGAAAVREFVGSEGFYLASRPTLRLLDLGAGLGAMTWGVVRALGEAGFRGEIDATLVDEDTDSLHAARDVVRAAEEHGVVPGGITLRVETRTASLNQGRTASHARYDLVVLGQVLSELSPRDSAEQRCEAHASLIRELVAHALLPNGCVVVVEPALRTRTRHLHAVRSVLLGSGAVSVVAPCLHAAACPMLATETDWCHEDLPVDLPAWLVPLARAAGLRWQGLTFSYLVLGAPSANAPLQTRSEGPQRRFRAVSDLLRSKGKVELDACDEHGVLQRIRRLDRDAGSEQGLAFDKLRRGDVVTLTALGESRGGGEGEAQPVDDRGRLARDTHVAVDGGSSRG
jgi:ribosomal protein RSM22 (predicted rRNA methylase)